jgi:hypothetical protein
VVVVVAVKLFYVRDVVSTLVLGKVVVFFYFYCVTRIMRTCRRGVVRGGGESCGWWLVVTEVVLCGGEMPTLGKMVKFFILSSD